MTNEIFDTAALNKVAAQIRYDLVRISQQTGVPHLACALSCVDILVALYFHHMRIDPSSPEQTERDRFYIGKGHAVAALYATLAHRGFFDVSLLDTIGQDGSQLEEHPGVNAPSGVEHVSGSLGHALSLACGRALATRLQKNPARHFVLMGDGETNEGTIWEAAMFAPQNQLNQVTAIVDFNKWQGTGRSCEIMSLEPMEEKWASFGWHTIRLNGHDINALVDALASAEKIQQPVAIIADTIKGKGISFMEDDNNWHYRIPTAEELVVAKQELLGA